jgi:hypothetical protein
MILKFSQFILEKYENPTRGIAITIDDAVNFYKENCSDWNLEAKQIYRGMPTVASSYLLYMPSEYTRESKNTYNVYTLLIDTFPSWSKFPKRSKSLICTEDLSKASGYKKKRCWNYIYCNTSK